MSQQTELSPLCPDWAFLNNANVHVAKSRGWFKTYSPIHSRVNCTPFLETSSYQDVLGIGTVEIPTKSGPNVSGTRAHRTLVLENVLHVPGAVCNYIGQPLLAAGFSVSFGGRGKSRGTIVDTKSGRNVAYFDGSRTLFILKLRHVPDGPPLGPQVIKNGELYWLQCRWEKDDVLKWAKRGGGGGEDKSGAEKTDVGSKSYTEEEKAWLKEHWGDEFRFLRAYGYSIYKEDEREEGRALMRAFMEEDGEKEGEDGV